EGDGGRRGEGAEGNQLARSLEDTELKRLRRTPGRDVMMWLVTHQCEFRTEGLAERGVIVTLHRQAAAFFWPIQREGRHDGVTATLQAPMQPRDIGFAISRIDQKV